MVTINRSICSCGVAICITNKPGGGWSLPPERRKYEISFVENSLQDYL